ncbi:hypothetical protein DFH06DRAFT_1304350, partial [Mycena polygramma]
MAQGTPLPVVLSLPTEILLEITAYYYNTILPYELHPKATTEKILSGRFHLLHALSRTCRYFRRIFVPLVWEYLEMVDDASDHHSNVLRRRMTGVLKTPSLPRCVRTLLVSLKVSSEIPWDLCSIFVRFLVATSHLNSLHIIDISERHAPVLTGLLQGRSFPAVRTLTIPTSLSRALSSFPNIISLTCADNSIADYYSTALLKESRKHCPSLEALVNFMPSLPVVNCLMQQFPRIKTLRFRRVLSSNVLTLLSDLEDLQSLRFPYRYQHRGETLEKVCDAAKKIFRQTQQPVQVEYLTPEADIGDIVVHVGPNLICHHFGELSRFVEFDL